MAEQKTRSPLRWAMDRAYQYGQEHAPEIRHYLDDPSRTGNPLWGVMSTMRDVQNWMADRSSGGGTRRRTGRQTRRRGRR
jgi:GAF domain-containing protein